MKNFKKLHFLLMPIIFFVSLSSFANGGGSLKSLKFRSKEGERVLIPLSEALLSPVISEMGKDLGGEEILLKQEIPLANIDRDTLLTIAQSLKKLKTLQNKKEPFNYQ